MGNVLQPFVSLALRTLFHAVDTILHEDEDLTKNQYKVTHIKLGFLNWIINDSAIDRTWVITECRNKEGFFLEITEVLSQVRTNF